MNLHPHYEEHQVLLELEYSIVSFQNQKADKNVVPIHKLAENILAQ